jgi:hypothetical protein
VYSKFFAQKPPFLRGIFRPIFTKKSKGRSSEGFAIEKAIMFFMVTQQTGQLDNWTWTFWCF